jgi:hypothetical protein
MTFKEESQLLSGTKIILGLIFLINVIENPELLDCQSPTAFYDSNYPSTLNMNYGTLYAFLSKFWGIFWAHLLL